MPTSTFQHDDLFVADPLPKQVKLEMADYPELQALLDSNETWADRVKEGEPDFFQKCAKGQWPKILWIGCADSRVPESVIMGRKPGEIFVHRNIANQFLPDDDSANALLDYAVLTVGVEHVIVVGHTGCGGCVAAHSLPIHEGTAPSALGRFLDPLIRLNHELGPDADVNELIRENVRVGVRNVANSEVMKKAYAKAQAGKGQPVHIHGWVYDLSTGLLQDQGVSISPQSTVSEQ